MVPVYVINLNRRRDRMEKLHAHLAHQGITYLRFPAFDSLVVEDEVLRGIVDWEAPLMPMGRGSMCCLRTNIEIFERIVKDNDQGALILQDDIVITPKFLPLLENANFLLKKFDIIQCESYGSPASWKLTGAAVDIDGANVKVRSLFSRSVGAAAFFISRRTAGLCLDNLPIRMPIDHFLFNPNISPIFKKLNVGLVMPAAAKQSQDFSSDLAADRKRGSDKSICARVKRVAYDIKPFRYQLTKIIAGARYRRFT